MSQNFFMPTEQEPEEVAYRDGAEGFIKWADAHVRVPIFPPGDDIPSWWPLGDLPSTPNPKTGRSYQYIWEEQKEVMREALRMENGRFVYRLIVLCWQRGEGKSLLACLVQLWKFFCWPRQTIVLGANSKDQVKFVHYDIMRDIILNSPDLLMEVGGARNIQEKQIHIKNELNKVESFIRAISSFSGIVSNITGYTFSEIFDMKNPKFFVQLDGSTRNIPNALGVIDSTVSSKDHVLYQLFDGYRTGKTGYVYFSYRKSAKGHYVDYWNPEMDQPQLDDYKVKFPFGEFERYFQNLWSAGHLKIFTPEMVEAWNYLGMDGELSNQHDMLQVLKKKNNLLDQAEDLSMRGVADALVEVHEQVDKYMERFSKVEERLYTLVDAYGQPRMATMDDLMELTRFYDTDWAVGVGIDRADPMKARTSARTIVTCIAKGLPKSRTEGVLFGHDGDVPKYIYILLHLVHVESSALNDLKSLIRTLHSEFDGVDVVCGERWGLWDMVPWCEEQHIPVEITFPTYDKQKEAFSELYTTVLQGRFKAPPIAVFGNGSRDILAEEAEMFDHDPEHRWFGSPEKTEKYGIQDDSMFALAWSMFGMKLLGVDQFRERKVGTMFGMMFENKELVGKW